MRRGSRQRIREAHLAAQDQPKSEAQDISGQDLRPVAAYRVDESVMDSEKEIVKTCFSGKTNSLAPSSSI
jgi:hypothetical protein